MPHIALHSIPSGNDLCGAIANTIGGFALRAKDMGRKPNEVIAGISSHPEAFLV